MKFFLSSSEILLAAIVIGGIAVAGWQFLGNDAGAAVVRVKVPQLSATATLGKLSFDANCAVCHGQNGSGTDKGPPLIHDIYNPGHHPDASFRYAVRQGVRQHHWSFGNMPPLPQLSAEQISQITRYPRTAAGQRHPLP